MLIPDIIEAMKNMSNSFIFGSFPEKDISDIIKCYPNLTRSSFYSKIDNSDNNMLCQGAVLKFQEFLNSEGVDNDYIFIRHNPIVFNREGFNNSDFFHEDSPNFFTYTGNFFDYRSKEECGFWGTHALVEIVVDGDYFVCDPYACIFYKTDLNNLLNNPSSVFYFGYSEGHLNWLLNNDIHINRSHRIYATPIFWGSVVKVSYGSNGTRDKSKIR